MSEIEGKKLRKYITPQELKENVVDWSFDTLKRRIRNEGFPAIPDGSSFLIPVEKMDLWFRQRILRDR